MYSGIKCVLGSVFWLCVKGINRKRDVDLMGKEMRTENCKIDKFEKKNVTANILEFFSLISEWMFRWYWNVFIFIMYGCEVVTQKFRTCFWSRRDVSSLLLAQFSLVAILSRLLLVNFNRYLAYDEFPPFFR